MFLRLTVGRSLTYPSGTPLRLSFKKALGHRRSLHPIAAPYDETGAKRQGFVRTCERLLAAFTLALLYRRRLVCAERSPARRRIAAACQRDLLSCLERTSVGPALLGPTGRKAQLTIGRGPGALNHVPGGSLDPSGSACVEIDRVGHSGCPLDTPSGSMGGSYRMVDEDGEAFDVEIPKFALLAPMN